MRWAWLALRDELPADAWAAALVGVNGEPVGYLVAWDAGRTKPEGAAKVDARAVNPAGLSGWASLVWAPDHVTLPFDDPAVSETIRSVLALPAAAVFSTLSVGDDRFVGALTACSERDGRLHNDPFTRLFPARLVAVGPGLLGATPALPGPVMQRYGGASPWPCDTFAGPGEP